MNKTWDKRDLEGTDGIVHFRYIKTAEDIVNFFLNAVSLDDRKSYRHCYQEYWETCAQHVSEDFFPSFQSHTGTEK